MTKEAHVFGHFGHLKAVIRCIHPQVGNFIPLSSLLCTEVEFLTEIQTKDFPSLLITVTLYSFALSFLFLQSHTTSYNF
jgi:hypothetical protein